MRDGRNVQLYHKSGIVASLSDLKKFNDDGTLKPRVAVYNKELQLQILNEIDLIHKAYQSILKNRLELTSENLEIQISHILFPLEKKKETLLIRFKRYIDEGVRDGLFGEVRKKNYMVVYRILERFLIINDKLDIMSQDFDSNLVMDFSLFVRDEYLFVSDWRGLYTLSKVRDIPVNRRSANTVATKMKYVHAFFRELEEKEEINKSPFLRLGRERKRILLRERYDEPVYLYASEFRHILDMPVPKELQEVKDVFCLQCAFGCRIGDFQKLTMDKVGVRNGIPYIHYLPHKTIRDNNTYEEIETPILHFAWDIIQKYKFSFPILRYISGKSGYNVKIKKLLKYCEIDRKCKVFNEEKGDNEYRPLHELASSKLCRKTHVDMMNKVQVNQYVAGLHKEGSDAVNRYTKLEFEDLFKLMCVAFGEPDYKIN